MHPWKPIASAALAASLSLAAGAHDARACAVFTPDETAPVTGHKMILSISNDSTTLWDQFSVAEGNNTFAWILPTKGTVEIGLSSDALFEALGEVSAPQIFAPSLCTNTCDSLGGGAGGGFQNGGVEVIAQDVIGPYETVQLSSQDPDALKDWLNTHGFVVPASVAPLLDAYVAEGFDFLALKLGGDKPTSSNAARPVRVKMQGAAPTVPIRLLAAGTGDVTQVTLWVVSEGPYEPTNAPKLSLSSSDLTWDFGAESSDYGAVKADKLAKSNGLGWLLEVSRPYDKSEIEGPLENLVADDPSGSGYGTSMTTPDEDLAADLAALFGDLQGSPWVTRLSADLSREALAADLQLGASASQQPVEGVYNPQNHVNDTPCPPDPCAGDGMEGDDVDEGCGCRVGGTAKAPFGLAGLALAAGLAAMRRRRRRA